MVPVKARDLAQTCTPICDACRFNSATVRWCLTVPAGLSQKSMALMRKAAMAAGLVASVDSPALIITSEPEAAALTAKQHKDLLGLQTGALQCFTASGNLSHHHVAEHVAHHTLYRMSTLTSTLGIGPLQHWCNRRVAVKISRQPDSLTAGSLRRSPHVALAGPSREHWLPTYVRTVYSACRSSAAPCRKGFPTSFNLAQSLVLRIVAAGGRLMIIDMGGGTVDMTIHKVDTAGDTVSLSELTHRECEAEVSLRNSRTFLGMGPID